MTRLSLVVVLLLSAVTASSQTPSANWQTIETEHFRVHFPAEYRLWSERVASRLESIRSAVIAEVGYDPPNIIDVIVSNPIAQANGFAWPLLDAPRIVLYTEAPGPDEQIGAYSNWIDLLAVHEVAHVIHMLRPSRNPTQRLVERYMLPLNSITLSGPRWILEGYATVVEGRLTGAGRPSSTIRAIILREWAASGRLPSYSSLDSDTSFLGMSMAYLAGSAYLEWLETKAGSGSLKRLWSRMTARQRRTFDAAFAGVFGDTPERLYGQFTAELTASAVAVNRAGDLREGVLWQKTPRASGDPAVSPDGSQIVVVVRPRNKPSRLVIWSTGPAEQEEKKYAERIAEMMKRDPQDVAPIRFEPLPRKAVRTFVSPDGGDMTGPRWMPDGQSILYSRRQPDIDGILHHDLFLWTPTTGENRRVTNLADVSDADPFPDGRTAIAVRSRYGLTQLVRVDLGSGAVTAITEPSLDTIQSHPRVSSTGRIAFVQHSGGRWSLRELDGPTCTAPGDVSSPEWTSSGDILATISAGGTADIARMRDCEWTPLTRTASGAFSPAPSPDGRLFFMSLDPDGFVVNVLANGTAPAPLPPVFDRALVPAIAPVPAAGVAFQGGDLTPPQEYGIGRQEWSVLAGLNLAPSQEATELGVRFGDVVGRLSSIGLVSIGDEDAQQGVAIASAWRGWPVEIAAHLFHSEDRREDRDGVELRARRALHFPRTQVTLEGGGLAAQPSSLAFGRARFETRQLLDAWRLRQNIEASAESGDGTHVRGVIGLAFRRGSFALAGRYQRDSVSDESEPIEVGGLHSSIIPDSAFARRVFDPALPVAVLAGDSYEGVRVEVTTPILPMTMFWQEHRMEDQSLALAGLEVTFSSQPYPLLRLSALDVTLGVARVFDEPLSGRTRGWFGLRWRP